MDISNTLRRLNHLNVELNGLYHEAGLRLGLSDSAMIILYTLLERGGSCALSELVRISGLSKQTVNSALRKLEGEGILYLQAAGIRTKDVCLTDAGLSLCERTARRLMDAENAVLAAWPPEDVRRYLELSQRFKNDLEAQIEKI